MYQNHLTVEKYLLNYKSQDIVFDIKVLFGFHIFWSNVCEETLFLVILCVFPGTFFI